MVKDKSCWEIEDEVGAIKGSVHQGFQASSIS
jgi:hypothetical protein